MYCRTCGNLLKDTDIACGVCGTSVAVPEAVSDIGNRLPLSGYEIPEEGVSAPEPRPLASTPALPHDLSSTQDAAALPDDHQEYRKNAIEASDDARSAYEREAEEYAHEVVGPGYLSEALGFGYDTWPGGTPDPVRASQAEETESSEETTEGHLSETRNEEMAESIETPEAPDTENPPPRKFDFDWGINAELSLAPEPSEEIDFKWRIDPEEIGRGQINSISAAADEKAREEAAKTRMEEARNIFHDDTFDLRRDPDAEARFLFNKKNEEFQELLDQEFLKMQERQAKIGEGRNRIDEDIMNAPIQTPEALVSGSGAYQAAEARINDFLMRADREMLEEIEQRVQARKKAMEQKENATFTLEDVETEITAHEKPDDEAAGHDLTNAETAYHEAADDRTVPSGFAADIEMPDHETPIHEPPGHETQRNETAGDDVQEPALPVESLESGDGTANTPSMLSIFDETVAAPIFGFPSTPDASTPDAQAEISVSPGAEMPLPDVHEDGLIPSASEIPGNEASDAGFDAGDATGIADAGIPYHETSSPEIQESVFIPLDKDADALPPYDWKKQARVAVPDIINQPIIFPFDEDTGYTEKTLYDEGTVTGGFVKEPVPELILDIENDIESEDQQAIESMGKAVSFEDRQTIGPVGGAALAEEPATEAQNKAASFHESFVDSSVVGPAFEELSAPKHGAISIAAAFGVETEAAVVHPMVIPDSLSCQAGLSDQFIGESGPVGPFEQRIEEFGQKNNVPIAGTEQAGENAAGEAPPQKPEEFGQPETSGPVGPFEQRIEEFGQKNNVPIAGTEQAGENAAGEAPPQKPEEFGQPETSGSVGPFEQRIEEFGQKNSVPIAGTEQTGENAAGRMPPQKPEEFGQPEGFGQTEPSGQRIEESGLSGSPDKPVETPGQPKPLVSNEGEAAEQPPRRKGGRIILTIFLDIVVILAVIIAGAFAILRFAPDTAIGNVINNAFYGIVEIFKGEPVQSPTGDDPTEGTEVVPDIIAPATDKAALINDQLFNNRNGIKSVVYDPSAKYEAGRTYPIADAQKSTSLGNNFWIEDAYGTILYDESAVASIIRYNSNLIGYINLGDTSILGDIVEGSKAELQCFGDVVQVTHLEMDYLGIGDIRRNGESIIVWTIEVVKEIRDGETFEINRKMVYQLKPEGTILKVNDFAAIE